LINKKANEHYGLATKQHFAGGLRCSRCARGLRWCWREGGAKAVERP